MEAIPVKPAAGQSAFVHGWVGELRKNPERAIPLSYARKFGKQLRVAKYSSKSGVVRYIEFGEFGDSRQSIHIKGSVKGSDMQIIGAYATEFEDMLRRVLGGGGPSRQYTLQVFRNLESFKVYSTKLGAPQAASLYDPRRYEIGTWFKDGVITREDFQEILCHEMTHAYMDLVYGVTSPLWFAEGTAEYFQHFRWDPKAGRCVPGELAQKELRALAASGGALPIREFVKLKREVMYGPDFEKLYAQAWATAHWIYTKRPDIAQRLLVDRQTVNEAGLEADFERHLDTLMKKVEWKA